MRNMQEFWYAQYDSTAVGYDEYGNQDRTYATYTNPVKMRANIAPAKGLAEPMEFGRDEMYDKVILTGERDTPITENTALRVDGVPELESNGALKVNADGEIVTPWDYIVRRVSRGLPCYGSTVIGITKVSVTGGNPGEVVSG